MPTSKNSSVKKPVKPVAQKNNKNPNAKKQQKPKKKNNKASSSSSSSSSTSGDPSGSNSGGFTCNFPFEPKKIVELAIGDSGGNYEENSQVRLFREIGKVEKDWRANFQQEVDKARFYRPYILDPFLPHMYGQKKFNKEPTGIFELKSQKEIEAKLKSMEKEMHTLDYGDKPSQSEVEAILGGYSNGANSVQAVLHGCYDWPTKEEKAEVKPVFDSVRHWLAGTNQVKAFYGRWYNSSVEVDGVKQEKPDVFVGDCTPTKDDFKAKGELYIVRGEQALKLTVERNHESWCCP